MKALRVVVMLLAFAHTLVSIFVIILVATSFGGSERVTGGMILAMMSGFPASTLVGGSVACTPGGVLVTLLAGFLQWIVAVLCVNLLGNSKRK